jgi:hypothetical protein
MVSIARFDGVEGRSVALLFLGTAFELLYIWKFDSAEGI